MSVGLEGSKPRYWQARFRAKANRVNAGRAKAGWRPMGAMALFSVLGVGVFGLSVAYADETGQRSGRGDATIGPGQRVAVPDDDISFPQLAWKDDAAVGQGAAAEDTEQLEESLGAPTAAVTVYVENDGGVIKPFARKDRHYTAGNAITYASRIEDKTGLPNWMDAISFESERQAVGAMFAHLLFTPGDIVTFAPQPNDRPFVAHAYGGFFLQRQRGDHFEHLGVNIGIIGPAALGQEVQSFIHDHVTGGDPTNGWVNQLPDEVTAQLTYRRKWRVRGDADWWEGCGIQWDVIPHVGFDLGTVQRQIEGGALGRIGVNLPDDFGPGRIVDPTSATGLATRGTSFYVFGAVRALAIEHNTYIEGSQFNDTLGVEAEPIFGEVRVGMSVEHHCGPGTFVFSYQVTFRTDAFKQQVGTNSQGIVVASWEWRD